MPKRTKGRNSTRKNKGFDNPSRKPSADRITGLFIDINGEKMYSDRTYDIINSPGGRAFAAYAGIPAGNEIQFGEGGGGEFVEVELGRKVIAMTVNTYGIKSDGDSTMTSKKSSTRLAVLGDFKYGKNGLLQSGEVTESANWSHFTLWDDGIGEYSSVDKGAPIQEKGIMLFQAWREHERVFDYLADYGDNLIEGDPKQNFYNFESSKYFENGWWDNPFATNLI